MYNFEIELYSKKEDRCILGNLDGQGLHELKTVKGVLNRLKNAKPMPRYKTHEYSYRIIDRRRDEIVYSIDVCDLIK